MALIGLFIGVVSPPAGVGAQEAPREAPEADVSALDGAFAGDLADLAGAHVEVRKTEGWVLLFWGLANVGAGVAMAAVGHEDDGWLNAGITTAAWGAINSGLSLILLDLGGSAAARAEQTRELRGRALFDRRDELIAGQRGSATLFALNTGLDVAYIVAGALLYGLGTAQSPTDSALVGVGGAILAQGGALLVFDIFNWVAASSRASSLRALGP